MLIRPYLVTELRLAGIADRERANAFRPRFLARYNARFAQPAAQPEPVFRPWPAGLAADTIFCFKYQRRVGNDNTVALGAQRVQILPGPRGRSYAQLSVDVHERLDGSLAVFSQGRCLASQTLTSPPPARVPARKYRRPRLTDPSAGTPALRRGIPIPPLTRKTRPGAAEKTTSPQKPRNQPNRAHVSVPAPDHPWRHMPVGKAKLMVHSGARTESLKS